MAPVKEYPRKLFYKIHEVANIVGVESYVLRYWETKFPMLKPERHGADERRYRQQDIDLLFQIRALLYDEKFTIAGAVDQMKNNPNGEAKVAEPEVVAEAVIEPVAEVVKEQKAVVEEDAQLSLFPTSNEQAIKNVQERLAQIKAEAVSLKATLEEYI